MSEFKRETRYVVFKISKLDELQIARLNDLLNVSDPSGKALPTVECLVVEHDWPEHEPVWKMIEERMTGKQAEPAPAQDERGAFVPQIYRASDAKDGQYLGPVVLLIEHNRAIEQARATRPAQTEQQTEQIKAPAEWAKMDPAFVVENIRQTTVFDADMIEAMLQFAIDAAALSSPSPAMDAKEE